MIAFGAVIGKTTPAQLIWLMAAQVPLYAINQHLVSSTFKALDMGGTIVIHLFGEPGSPPSCIMYSGCCPSCMHGLSWLIRHGQGAWFLLVETK
jgi:ammonium transporter Rh